MQLTDTPIQIQFTNAAKCFALLFGGTFQADLSDAIVEKNGEEVGTWKVLAQRTTETFGNAFHEAIISGETCASNTLLIKKIEFLH